jgi:hypothetical protein
LNIHFSIILLSAAETSKLYQSVWIAHQNPVRISPLPHMGYMPYPYHSLFDYPYDIWWGL